MIRSAADHARVKAESRQADERALALGLKTREQLTRENNLIPPGRIDWARFVAEREQRRARR
jgi:hypothetical protein